MRRPGDIGKKATQYVAAASGITMLAEFASTFRGQAHACPPASPDPDPGAPGDAVAVGEQPRSATASSARSSTDLAMLGRLRRRLGCLRRRLGCLRRLVVPDDAPEHLD